MRRETNTPVAHCQPKTSPDTSAAQKKFEDNFQLQCVECELHTRSCNTRSCNGSFGHLRSPHPLSQDVGDRSLQFALSILHAARRRSQTSSRRYLELRAIVADCLQELVLTTNGTLLWKYAHALRSAGVQRLNVSLDSLRPETFSSLARGGNLESALDGIAAAEQAGFPSVKINTVVIRGMNDDELLDFAAMTLRTPRQIRFIEYMPTTTAPDWSSAYVSGDEILRRLREVYELEAIPSAKSAGPAAVYRIPGAMGTIGVITPISNHFCASSNRIRVTASGVIKGCLFESGGVSLRPYLNRSDDELRDVLLQVLRAKPNRHHLTDNTTQIAPFAMSQIGG